jgi:hypothetical protein
MWGKMIKSFSLALFFTIVTYAIVSDLGKPQHGYSAPGIVTLAD